MKNLRIALAVIFVTGITLLLAGLAGVLHPWLGWMAKLQFLPAVLALNIGVIVFLIILTLLFGRVYCSVICPLGVLQDGISWLAGLRKKRRFSWSPEIKWLRYGVWVIFVAALIAGVQVFVALLAPYSAYGRMVRSVIDPKMPVVLVAAVTFVVVAVLAWLGGRTWCNTICPVGTTLSFFSRFAIFRPVIDASKCKNCKLCEKNCKASCINIQDHKIDYSRCVDCFNCLDNCKFGALHYRFAYGKKASAPAGDSADKGRRAFLATAAVLAPAAALQAQTKKLDGGFAEIIDKKNPERTVPLTPFGSKSVKDFYKHCTACQLCISACPNNVLRPSMDIDRLMQPEMGYENGYCRPECTKCSQVCPAGAILPLTPEEKTAVHIGTATVDRSLCVVERDGVSCGNCARHCPVGAIRMVRLDPEDPDSLRIPAVDESRCIGCGACENLCPSRPYSAIHVNGLQVHINS